MLQNPRTTVKNVMKFLAFYISSVAVLPLILLYRGGGFIGNRTTLFQTCIQILCIVPSKLGVFLRAAFLSHTAIDVNKNVSAGFLTLFSNPDLSVGNHVYFGSQCNIGSCSIGNDCLIGSGVHILSGKNQHHFAIPGVPIRNQGGMLTKIQIGSNCWIGNNATILANLGNNVIVAAGSVVVHEVPSNSIAGGNPATVLKSR